MTAVANHFDVVLLPVILQFKRIVDSILCYQNPVHIQAGQCILQSAFHDFHRFLQLPNGAFARFAARFVNHHVNVLRLVVTLLLVVLVAVHAYHHHVYRVGININIAVV